MRVGVYGRRPGAEADRTSDGVPEDTVVRYSVHGLKEQINRRRVAGGQGQGLAANRCTSKWCRCNRLPSSEVRRRRLRAGAVDEVRRLTALEPHAIPEQALDEEPDGSSVVAVGESGIDAAEAESDTGDWLLL